LALGIKYRVFGRVLIQQTDELFQIGKELILKSMEEKYQKGITELEVSIFEIKIH
jgi:hypothetical protein